MFSIVDLLIAFVVFAVLSVIVEFIFPNDDTSTVPAMSNTDIFIAERTIL